MKKKILSGSLTLLLALALTACNTPDESVSSTNVAGEIKTSSAEKTSDAQDDTTASESVPDCCTGDESDSAGTSSAELEKTSFGLGYLNSTAHLLGFVAKEEGYFEEEGLDVTLTQFSSASELATGLETGKLDVAFIGSVPTLTFQSQGHDLTIFGGAMTNGHGYVIKPEFVSDSDNIDITALKGRNVASVKNSVQDAELQILLRNAGIEIGEGDDQVNIVYFDSQKDAFAALQNSTIDAASVYSPYASLAKAQGYEVVYYCSEEEALQNQPCCRQVAETSALKENPNSYAAFERALIKAYKFTQENEDATIADVKKYIDIDEDYIRTEVYGGYSYSSPDPDKQGTVTLKETIVEFGYTDDYDIESLYNTEIYSAALDSLISENPDDAVYAELKQHFEQYE
jgi:NitT/TauT family transport system substrate-binding protein